MSHVTVYRHTNAGTGKGRRYRLEKQLECYDRIKILTFHYTFQCFPLSLDRFITNGNIWPAVYPFTRASLQRRIVTRHGCFYFHYIVTISVKCAKQILFSWDVSGKVYCHMSQPLIYLHSPIKKITPHVTSGFLEFYSCISQKNRHMSHMKAVIGKMAHSEKPTSVILNKFIPLFKWLLIDSTIRGKLCICCRG